ncbi:MAG: 30S ribosomal protein S9, partial [Candidatus Micrarchaeia archaeon]
MAKRKTTKTAEAADVEKIESSEKLEKENLEQSVEEKESKQDSKVKKRTSKKQIVVSARRKMAIARSTIKPGKGIVRINKMNLNAIDNPYVKTLISEPLKIAND